jgi:hypothetical protein
MPRLQDRGRPLATLPLSDRGPARPVVLATLSVRVDRSAERMVRREAGCLVWIAPDG